MGCAKMLFTPTKSLLEAVPWSVECQYCLHDAEGTHGKQWQPLWTKLCVPQPMRLGEMKGVLSAGGHEVEHAVGAHAAAKMFFFFLWMLPSESTMERRPTERFDTCERARTTPT